ncbi:Uncharacterised protein [Yersinia pseudotuberculosis]|uniref:Uncharacterized protein n=1 Tax=Yersinia pseudotuberculosis TaxID=633 RepID=A0A380Q959_YERPU|nr:Uncharacterised protein [Yersinia pseudotuberculosis]
MLGGADNTNGELPSYITGADTDKKDLGISALRFARSSYFYHRAGLRLGDKYA